MNSLLLKKLSIELRDIEESSIINEDNLFLKIWTKPRSTLRYIRDFCPRKYLNGLLLMAAVSQALSKASYHNLGAKLPFVSNLFLMIFAGGIFGWIIYTLLAEIIAWTGRWMGGDSNARDVKIAMAWSSVPLICSIILLIPQVLILRGDFFRKDWSLDHSLFSIIIIALLGLVEIALTSWSLFLLIICISEVQIFSLRKAVYNLVISGGILLIPIISILLLLLTIIK